MRSNYYYISIVFISICWIKTLYGSDFFQSFGGKNPFGTTNMGSKNAKDDEYYKRLGIDNTATVEQIKKAYRKQAMVSHPDKGGDAEQFKKLNEAYEVLSDSEKRAMYDRYGKEGLSPNMGSSGSPFGFGDVFRGFSTFSMPVMMQLDLTLEDMYNGKEIKIPVRAGTFAKIKIEPGMMAGQQLMLRGQLVDSKGSPRDVIFRLNELAHSTFQRRNADLLIDLKITLREALLGFEKAIKHLDGKEIWLKNRKGEVTSPGDVLMLKDMGMPIYNHPSMRGRLFIRIKVIFPKKQWCDEIQLKELSKLLPPAESTLPKSRRKRPEEPVVHANPADLRSFGQMGGVSSSSGFDGMGEEEDGNPFAQFFFR